MSYLSSAVDGSMTVVTFATEFAEKPPCFACSKTAMEVCFYSVGFASKGATRAINNTQGPLSRHFALWGLPAGPYK